MGQRQTHDDNAAPSGAITLHIPTAQLEWIAQRVAELNRPARPHSTIAEAAQELRVSERTITRMLRAGRLRAAKVGGRRVLVTRESIDAQLAEQP